MTNNLSEDEDVLFRQVHPNFIQDGIPSSQPFVPTQKDNSKLSVDRSKLTNAEAAFDRFIESGQFSDAVYGVTVAEFATQGVECFSDPIVDPDPKLSNPTHAYANYSPFSVNAQKNKAKRIKQHALARGRLHPK